MNVYVNQGGQRYIAAAPINLNDSMLLNPSPILVGLLISIGVDTNGRPIALGSDAINAGIAAYNVEAGNPPAPPSVIC